MRTIVLSITALVLTGACVTSPPARESTHAGDTDAKALVLDFYNKVLLGGDLSLADQYIHKDYIQNNPQIPGGLDGFVSYFTDVNARLDQMNATIEGEIEHVVAEDDRVMLIVAYTIDGPIDVKFRAADLFRVENGMIVEHWDVRQGETIRDHQLLMQN